MNSRKIPTVRSAPEPRQGRVLLLFEAGCSPSGCGFGLRFRPAVSPPRGEAPHRGTTYRRNRPRIHSRPKGAPASRSNEVDRR
ncbi:hypothetical protein YT1_2508 [Rhodococcus ruber]|nr:hypothetical protein YT1_2508 [Rhodococcus ruber]